MSDRIYISNRDEENSVSNRSLLSNAVGTNTEEIEKLTEYRDALTLIETYQQELQNIRMLPKINTSKKEGFINYPEYLAKQIEICDKKLIDLEATAPLQIVLEREKQKAYQRLEQRGNETLEEYKNKEIKHQEELLKRYQERVETKKKEKQLSEAPKQKKSKIKKFLFKLEDEGFFSILWYFSLVLWFGFVGRVIIVSNLHIIVKTLMIIGDLWWLFYVFCQHYFNNENEE